MLTIVHLLIGAVIGKAFGNLWLVIPLAILSHYILDLMPRGGTNPVKGFLKKGLRGCDKKDLLLKSIEPAIAMILIIYFLSLNSASLSIALGVFFAWFPDFLVFLSWKGHAKFPSLLIRHHKQKLSVKGFILELILIAAAIGYLII